MTDNQSLQAIAAQLRTRDQRCQLPQIVHRETLLQDVQLKHPGEFILIKDDDNRLLGIVPVSEVRRRLTKGNKYERSRWSQMPVGALSNLSFADGHVAAGDGPADTDLECSTIREGDRLLGIATNDDIFISWRRLESLFTAALMDPLTGLMNRLAYERRIREEWNRSTRTNTSVAVVVVDLDDFKAVNDTWGHATGDLVLTAVARQLELAMRSYDVVARFGGDEFVALCLGCAPGDIQIPVQRLLRSIDQIRIPCGAQRLRVKASIGAAVRHMNFSENLADDLFVAADDCLYEAKGSDHRAWCVEFGLAEAPVPRPLADPKAEEPRDRRAQTPVLRKTQ